MDHLFLVDFFANAQVGHKTFDLTGLPHVGQTGFVNGFLLPVAGLADIFIIDFKV